MSEHHDYHYVFEIYNGVNNINQKPKTEFSYFS
jgi:hypothetical protein